MANEFKAGDKARWRGQVVTILAIEGNGEYAKIKATKPPVRHHFRGRYGGTSVDVGEARAQVYSVQPAQLKPVTRDESEITEMPPHIQQLIDGEY